MARTKQTKRQDSKKELPRAVFGNAGNGMNMFGKKKNKAKKKKWRRRSWDREGYEDRINYLWQMNSLVDRYHDRLGYINTDDDMGHSELDDEVLLGNLRGNIVGIQYYRGTVNNNEMVAIEREPHNKYDCNAIRILNVGGTQVGHIKRELAKPLAHIVDNGWARLEGIVPFGSTNMYSMPVNLTLWGKPEYRQAVADKLRGHGFNAAQATELSSSVPGGSGLGMPTPRRTFMTPDEMKSELDSLFENLEEGDKTSTAEPAKVIATPMYTHQKQALNWMIQRENGSKLPPFWEEKKGRFFNSVTVFTTDKRPQSVKGGILADDMGLGKTLEMIALIMTNFKDGLPLAVPVPGKVRQSKLDRIQKSAQRLASYKLEPKPMAMKKINLKRENMSNFIVDDSKPSTSMQRKFVRNLPGAGFSKAPQLPCLPDDDISDTDTSVDSDDEDYDEPRKSFMMKGEDPEFVPKGYSSKENVPMSSRPKRSARRTVRYTDNTDIDLTGSPAPKGFPSQAATATVSSSATATASSSATATVSSPATHPSSPATKDLSTIITKDALSSLSTDQDHIQSTVLAPEPENSKVICVASVEEQKREILSIELTPCSALVSLESNLNDTSNSMSETLSCTSISTDLIPYSSLPSCTALSTGTDVVEPPKDVKQSDKQIICDTAAVAEELKDSQDKCKTEGTLEQNKEKETCDSKGQKKSKPTKTRAGIALPVISTPSTSGRPRRNAKKPARYAVSSDSEVENSPMKRARVNKKGDSCSVAAKKGGKGKGKGKLKLMPAENMDQGKITAVNMESSNTGNKDQTKTKDIPNPGRSRENKVDPKLLKVENMASVLKIESTAPILKIESKTPVLKVESTTPVLKVESKAPDMEHNKGVAMVVDDDEDLPDPGMSIKPELSTNAGIIDLDCDDLPDPSVAPSRGWNSPHISDDDLPDIPDDIALHYNSPGPSACGKMSGRTYTKGARATLIIAPLSVISNWQNQLEDHLHENAHLEIYTYYGSSRTKDPTLLSKQDVVLTTYSTLAADAKGKNILVKVDWLRLVLDEGHNIRNPNAQQTKAICQLKAERKWILTGTPIQNSMKDLWSLVNFLQINPFTDRQWWRRTIERPLDQGEESALRRVCHLMSAIALRRTKTQKLNDKPLVELPDRKVFVEHIKMTEDERNVYEAMQNEGKVIVSKYFKQGTLLHNYGEVLAILMRLRQMCCHPLLIAKAAAAVKEVLENVPSASGNDGLSSEAREKLISTLLMVLGSGSDEECAICLDTLKEPVITHCAHVYCRNCIASVIKTDKPRCPLCRGDVDEDKLLEVPPEQLQEPEECDDDVITPENWKSSSKVDAVINALVTLRKEDNTIRSVVVSQFTSLLSLLEIPLRAQGFRFTRLDGTMNLKTRMRAVEEFMDPSPVAPTIMLLSLKAGGVGINLTSASRVFLMDPAWNPAAEEQCFDRCHRLGQKRDVIITKFIVDDSVEVRMMDLQEKKRKLMQGAFGAAKKETAEQRRQNRIKEIKTLMNF
ncbi:helicase-like transcription factor [Argopecten irradians]|uniref:helicase-like transcription factor n=1 Tax=Argopecten irradians TaxID=31199 RepID=UPI003714080E